MRQPTKKSAFLASRRGNQKTTARTLGSGSAVSGFAKKLPSFKSAPRDLTQVIGRPQGSGTKYSTYEPQGVLSRSARVKPRLVVRALNKTERDQAALIASPATFVATSAPTQFHPMRDPVGAKITTSPIFWLLAGVGVFFWAVKGGVRP